MTQVTPPGRYDLVSEHWVCLRAPSGAIEQVPLADALTQAQEFTGLAGDSPTQDAALLRLLLALVRVIYPEVRSAKDWKRLWDTWHFDEDRVRDYLAARRDRFDLIHPVTPFYQVAGLTTTKGEMTDLARLVPDVPAGHQFFTVRSGRDLRSMDFAEAARWLVHAHAFDASGIKSGAVGDDRVKGGKGYPIGTAWCGWLGLVIPEGGTLFETLLLNLQLPAGLPDPATDLPAWEREPLGPGIEEGHTAPRGPADLLTWQSRRIRLAHDGERVTGVLIANGDPLHPRDQFKAEFMTNWRSSEAQKKARKSAVDVYMPRAHQPGRAAWRGMEALLAYPDRDAAGVPGGWLEWLSRLTERRCLPKDHPVRLRTVGMEYGAQSAVIADLIDDRLNLSLAVMTEPELKRFAIDAVHDSDHAAQTLGRLAFDLAHADGASDQIADAARGQAREQLYDQLDPLYRRWVAGLNTVTEEEPARRAWQLTVHQTTRRLARGLVASTAPAAWSAYEDGAPRQSAAKAEHWFYINLKRHLPYAYLDEEGDGA